MLKHLVSVCVLLSAAIQAAPSKLDSKSSRQLYEQAAKAIASADSRGAITPLEQLIAEQPTSSLACIAAVHLAECYVAAERPVDAATLLESWSNRIETASKSTKLNADLDAHHLRVWLHAAKRISDDSAAIKSLDSLTKILESREEILENTKLVEVISESRVELARRLAASGKFELAAKQIDRLTDFGRDITGEAQLLAAMIQQQLGDHTKAQHILQALIDEPETPSHMLARLELASYAMQDRAFETAAKMIRPIIATEADQRGFDKTLDCRFRMLWSELELAQGNAIRSLEVLPSDEFMKTLDEPQQIAIRFSRAEVAALAGKHAMALEELQWLDEHARKATTEPAWALTVALRQCELHLKTKDYVTLTAAAEEAKKRFANYKLLHEFDYLLARAAMLQIEFAQARIHLQAITQSAAAKKSSAAVRAQWMLGETYFLEQNLNEAITAYRPVTELKEMQPWQTLALMQTAKCFELLNRFDDALDAYQRVVTSTTVEKIRQEATARIEVIERVATRAKLRPLR